MSKSHDGRFGVLEPETPAEEAERRQLAGFFEGEGSIGSLVWEDGEHRVNHKMRPTIQIEHAELGGFAEAEGSIELGVGRKPRCSNNYEIKPSFRLGHTQQPTIKEKLQRYYDLAGKSDLEPIRYDRSDNRQPTYSIEITGVQPVATLLGKLFPWLGHKQRQATIMLNEILPRMERGTHLRKPGFIKLMELKEKLDAQKPMGNDDRKYTADYFRDLWDMENQLTLSESIADD